MKIARFFVCRRAGRKLAFVRNRGIQKRGHLRKQDAVFALDCRMARGGTGKRSVSDVIPAGECQRPNPRRECQRPNPRRGMPGAQSPQGRNFFACDTICSIAYQVSLCSFLEEKCHSSG